MMYAILLGLLLAAPAPPARTDDVSVLVRRYIAWRGGPAYEAVTSIHEKGRAEAAGLEGSFERYAGSDGLERRSFVLGGFEGSSAVIPSGSWNENNGVVLNMPDAAALDARRLRSYGSRALNVEN